MAQKTKCLTNGAVFHAAISEDKVSISVDLPFKLDISEAEAEILLPLAACTAWLVNKSLMVLNRDHCANKCSDSCSSAWSSAANNRSSSSSSTSPSTSADNVSGKKLEPGKIYSIDSSIGERFYCGYPLDHEGPLTGNTDPSQFPIIEITSQNNLSERGTPRPKILE